MCIPYIIGKSITQKKINFFKNAAYEKGIGVDFIRSHAPQTSINLLSSGFNKYNCSGVIKPFLFNLFNDKAIISLPQPFRFLLAKLISHKRTPKAQNIYKQINNKSPILAITSAQAESLEKELSFYGDYQVFVNMRYTKPNASEVVEKIKTYNPSDVVLLPLYPQFSSTTSASSINDFLANFKDNNVKIICLRKDIFVGTSDDRVCGRLAS